MYSWRGHACKQHWAPLLTVVLTGQLGSHPLKSAHLLTAGFGAFSVGLFVLGSDSYLAGLCAAAALGTLLCFAFYLMGSRWPAGVPHCCPLPVVLLTKCIFGPPATKVSACKAVQGHTFFSTHFSSFPFDSFLQEGAMPCPELKAWLWSNVHFFQYKYLHTQKLVF